MRRVGVFANPGKPEFGEVIGHFIGVARRKGLEVVLVEGLTWVEGFDGPRCDKKDLAERSDLVVAFGGDGTMLRAAEAVGASEVPILGVNLGRLGFLTAISPEELEGCLDRLVVGDFALDSRMALVGRLQGDAGEAIFALNDLVIEKGACSRIVEVEVAIGGEPVTDYLANGLIIATPTGSTAYCLSAGGPIVHHKMDALVLAPICSHSLSMRAMVVPGDHVVEATVHSAHDEMMLTADARFICRLRAGDRITVRRAPHPIHLISLKGLSFYDVLKRKLAWGIGHEVTRGAV